MAAGPNPLVATWSIIRARRHSRPEPRGSERLRVDHAAYAGVLLECLADGPSTLRSNAPTLLSYRDEMEEVDPDELDAAEALAYWVNLYNAGALWTASRALTDGAGSVLRVPGAFTRPWATVTGVRLSLDDIEHGKIRRFGDPRIHGALVCGSVSCPTLRSQPFTGDGLDAQLDAQLRSFIARGGGTVTRRTSTVHLSSIFRWYGGDFTAPHRMPSLTPARPSRLRDTLAHWFPGVDAVYIWEHAPRVRFQPYDWGLGCTVA